jgi:hypothetical protein
LFNVQFVAIKACSLHRNVATTIGITTINTIISKMTPNQNLSKVVMLSGVMLSFIALLAANVVNKMGV